MCKIDVLGAIKSTEFVLVIKRVLVRFVRVTVSIAGKHFFVCVNGSRAKLKTFV